MLPLQRSKPTCREITCIYQSGKGAELGPKYMRAYLSGYCVPCSLCLKKALLR